MAPASADNRPRAAPWRRVVAPQTRPALGTRLEKGTAYCNEPSIALARRLTENSVFDRVFFANSGAEANEGAIKLVGKWGQLNKGGAFEIITFDNGFHGRTLATMSALGKPGWDVRFAPQVAGFPKARLNDLASVEALIGRTGKLFAYEHAEWSRTS